MNPDSTQLREQARAWLAADPDPETRAELRHLVDAQREVGLAERFGKRLEFGTAGIRGVRGAGPGRMNRLLVRLVTAGLGQVLSHAVGRALERGVVVGYDGRVLSAEMAADACSVLAGQGFRVVLLEGPKPTPLLAFAVLRLGAAAGVMVTASHNPPEYNGYKVYWEDGAQIVPPIDREISAAIDAIAAIAAIAATDAVASPERIPWLDVPAAQARGLLVKAPADLEERYLEAVAPRLPPRPFGDARPELRIVYTPLHGVGLDLALAAFRRRGLSGISVVEAQARPDGRFPTTRSPNPEDDGALELALAQARSEGADLILANDPDGDRLAALVLEPGGDYRRLSGDELGCILGHSILEAHHRAGTLPARGFVVTTVVSSKFLSQIAQHYQVHCEETLTGLKWIWHRSLELERRGWTFLFGYEEALGYSISPQVRDKDGIGAATLLCDIALRCAAEGKSLLDYLDDMFVRFGLFVTRHLTFEQSGPDGMRRLAAALDHLRDSHKPAFAGRRVTRRSDFSTGEILDTRTHVVTPSTLPRSNVLILELEDQCRVALRPSGTEPKLKAYLEARAPATDRASLKPARHSAQVALDELEQAVQQAFVGGCR